MVRVVDDVFAPPRLSLAKISSNYPGTVLPNFMDLLTIIERLATAGDSTIPNEISLSSRKRASVLIPILPDGTILLTQRTKHLRSHGGEVCFPGGKQDPEDNGDDIRTALRETEEEVGINGIRPIGHLPSVESYHGLCVTPVIGVVETPIDVASLNISKAEVDAVFAVPLEYFANDANLSGPVESIVWRGGTFDMRTYEYTYEGRSFTIWGLTAYIAHQAASIATFRGEGSLLRYLQMQSSSWIDRYFKVFHDEAMLQQEHGSSGKESLSLKRISVNMEQHDGKLHDQQIHPFTIHELDSKESWKLAARNETQRLQWIVYLKGASSSASFGSK